jgi:hypothetical protein
MEEKESKPNPKFNPKHVESRGDVAGIEKEQEMLPSGRVEKPQEGNLKGNIPDTAPEKQAPQAAHGLPDPEKES